MNVGQHRLTLDHAARTVRAPEAVAANPASVTGHYLKEVLSLATAERA